MPDVPVAKSGLNTDHPAGCVIVFEVQAHENPATITMPLTIPAGGVRVIEEASAPTGVDAETKLIPEITGATPATIGARICPQEEAQRKRTRIGRMLVCRPGSDRRNGQVVR